MVRLPVRLWLIPAIVFGLVRAAGAQVQGTPGPTLSPPSSAAPVLAPNGALIYPATQSTAEVIIPPTGPLTSEEWCLPPQEPGRTSSWTAAVEFIPSYTRVTDGQFGRWTDDATLAMRLILGYEDPEGLGLRARFWALSQEAEVPADDVDLSMGKFDLDLYKRLFLDRGEVAIGAGPTSGSLEFELSDNTHTEFTGAGGTIFVDGYYSLVEFDKSEFGAVARGRYSILLGDWRDTTGIILPSTDNDTMAITELAWGVEYRSRFGPCEDHSWFVGLLAEYQRWQSDWMTRFAGTSLGVSGVNIYTGLNW